MRYTASNLFGAAFEDLLATDLPDGRNIADDYLRRRGWKESVSTREYIVGLRRSVISLYEVSGLVPGESMLLRDLVRGGEPVTERTDLDQMLAAERPAHAPTGMSPEQERTLVQQMMDDHYRRVLDETIPALGGKTPRAAAKTAKGRAALVAWLKTLENHSGRQKPGDPIASYDFGWLWDELGVQALRR